MGVDRLQMETGNRILQYSEYIIDWYWMETGIKLLIAVKIWLNTNEMKGLRMNIYSGFIN